MGRRHLLPLAIVLLMHSVLWPTNPSCSQEVAEGSSVRGDSAQPRSVPVWDATSSKDVLTLQGHTNSVVSATFFSDGKKVLTGSGDRTARVWNAQTGEQLITIEGTGSNHCYASVNMDGSRILTVNTPVVKIWDAQSGCESRDFTRQVGLERHWPFPFHGSFSPDGKQIATASPVFQLSLRDTQTGDAVRTFEGIGYWPNWAIFSPNGKHLACGCQTVDDAVRIWDLPTGSERLVLKDHGGSAWSACFAPDSQRIATGSVNGKVRIWNVNSGKVLVTLMGHKRIVTAISFSPDGTRVLTGSQDGTARIWDAEAGTELFILRGHTGIVNAARFSPDGQRLVTASSDKTARIWDFQRFQDTRPADVNAPGSPSK
ncbi:MAG: WD40 repeat domain-containing protein [Pirellulales bacterium]